MRGDVVEIQPAYAESAYRISFFGDEVEQISHFDPLTGEVLAQLDKIAVFPATHYVTDEADDRARVRTTSGTSSSDQVALFERAGPDARGAPHPRSGPSTTWR